ncbi:hypothetical protein GCK72_000280 [Caenorhabditis remanei]|uniref:F-box domain-containing protein n=1 Tax=Caenorhabditis remanei TaxID=31234 RepID=A0A6A5HKQ8_CAERE|nr:hypothetical protein GCK72_000280 [Caenorhabditis remanei]KAF1768468.1 hypothetical protein GCK72_000280 [Caenorhabditis remanei]
MTVIPLFKLPVLCINEILIHTDIISLVSLSLISRRSKRLVRTSKTSLAGFNIEIKNDVTQVQFVTSEKEDAGSWFFKIEEKESGGGEVIEMRRPFYMGFNESDNLLIKGEKTIENDDLKSIMENLTVKNQLALMIPTSTSFECNMNIFKFKQLVCLDKKNSGHLITREVLMSLKCTLMQFHHTLLEADDVMPFFERWYHSDDTEFTILLVKTDKSFAGMNFDRFHPTQWNPEQRGPKFLYTPRLAFDCTRGMDIMRKDGLLCTVDNRINVLIFAVWHNRFHDVSGVSKNR